MHLMGIGDEAGGSLDSQIKATKALGWKHIEMRGVEVPGFAKDNFHNIPEAAFDQAVAKLQENGISVYAFGSTIMNWAKTVETPFDVTIGEVKRAIPRMQKIGTKYVRIMSFKPTEDAAEIPAVVFERVREVTKMFLDAGIQPVHENCMNYGGISWQHGVQMIEKVPGLKWVFDTANPIFNFDRRGAKPWGRQDPWEFWLQMKPYTAHIHIKDATWNPAKNDADYNWPGEGQGRVKDILRDAFASGYDAGISIEPHMVVVFHDTTGGGKTVTEADTQANFIEYGKRLEKLIAEVKAK